MRVLYNAWQRMRPATTAFCIFVFSGVLLGQSGGHFPSPAGRVNDFAGVVEAQTRNHLEAILENLKTRTQIDFYVATVDTTEGQKIFEFSQQMANAWNIGAKNADNKSLLLVVAVASKTSFTQLSRLAQFQLPDGILGDMTQRMGPLLAAGQFSRAINVGVSLFVNALGQKLGFAAADLEPTTSAAELAVKESPAESEQEPPKTRPRVVNPPAKQNEPESETKPSQEEASPPREEAKPAEEEAKPAKEESKTAGEEDVKPTPQESKSDTDETKPASDETPGTSAAASEPETKAPTGPGKTKASNSTERPRKTTATTTKNTAETSAETDADESEEVELTLTLPLAKRAESLKEFLETHPESKSRPRAIELLISTHAGLGDQLLKAGDIENGIKQFMLAIEQADENISDKLFSGVIAQIPSNLFLRKQSEAALNAAIQIENKFASDPKRLLAVAGFYVGIERGDEAVRVSEEAVKLAPESAEAHRVLALSHHINLQLDEAAAEYKRTVELDPNSRVSLASLADLMRGTGKTEDALTIYDELLKNDPKDHSAITGRVICLLDLGRIDEANIALDAALAEEPRNLALLSGTAYWFAAHNNYEKAIEMARKAIEIEPRYTWSQIALVRSLIGMKRPVGAERAMRYAKQFGKFPTLNYELANVVAVMGFYDEAVEILKQSFSYKDGEIETLLAGRIPAHDSSFTNLLAPERRASIFQITAADSTESSRTLKNLLALDAALTSASDEEKNDPEVAAKAAQEFASGTDAMRTFRQLYAASRLLSKRIALSAALDLVEESKTGLEEALDVSVATSAAQADALRNLRAQAIAGGNIPDIAEAPRSALTNIMKGRIEDLTGWILFNQDHYSEAIEHLQQATTILPVDTPAWRNSLWHLGVAFEQTGKNEEALENYIKSYNAGEREQIRRTVIENVYRKVNGSTDGLEDKIGPPLIATTSDRTTSTESEKPAPTLETIPAEPLTAKTQPDPSAPASTEPASSSVPASPTSEQAPTQSSEPSEQDLRAAGARLRSTIKITGRVVDAAGNGLSNVVVVLISPSGSVLAATTNNDGDYSFTVTPAAKTYRIIPSKVGYSFSPVDKTFAGLLNDQTGIDFTGSANR